MIISKTTANQIAEKMLSKRTESLKVLRSNFSKVVAEIYAKGIPDSVKKTFIEHKEYFRSTSSVQLVNNGFNYDWVNFSGSYPCMSHNCTLCVEKEDSKLLLQLYHEIISEKDSIDVLKKEIEVALLTLKTDAKIKLSFPEAFLYLPEKNSTAVSIDLSSLRNKLS